MFASAAWRMAELVLYSTISTYLGNSLSVDMNRQASMAAMAARVSPVERQKSSSVGTTTGFLRLRNKSRMRASRMSSAIICLVANSAMTESTSVPSVALAKKRAL